MKSTEIAELSKALAKAQGQFEHAKKDTSNPFFKSKYADLAAVIDAAKKPLSDNGLAVIQTTGFLEGGVIVLYTMLSHESGEWVEGAYPIQPIKQDPQGYGSALTYARRYAFSAITGIASDDDDGNAASQGKPVKKPNPKTASNEVREQLELCKTQQDLDIWKAEYKPELNTLKIDFPEAYSEIIARGTELANIFKQSVDYKTTVYGS